jgi:hypothetical protein
MIVYGVQVQKFTLQIVGPRENSYCQNAYCTPHRPILINFGNQFFGSKSLLRLLIKVWNVFLGCYYDCIWSRKAKIHIANSWSTRKYLSQKVKKVL